MIFKFILNFVMVRSLNKDLNKRYVKIRQNGTMYFFSMTLLPILRRIQRPTTQGYSSNAKYENSRKIETYRNYAFFEKTP